MLGKTDSNAMMFVVAAVFFFMVGGILTTVVPPLVDSSWARPFENDDPSQGPTGKLEPYTEQELAGREIYVKEGCCTVTRSRPAPCWRTPNDRDGGEWTLPYPLPTSSFTTAPISSAPSGPGPIFPGWEASTTRSGT